MSLERDMKTTSITKNKVGHPTVITPEIETKLESIFKIGGTNAEACSYAGISEMTYYSMCERNDKFLQKMESAKHYPDIVAKNVVVDSILKDKDLNSAKWWLEKREFRNTGNNVAVQVNFNQKLENERKEFEL